MEKTEEQVVEFLLSEWAEQQVFSSYLQKEGAVEPEIRRLAAGPCLSVPL